MPRKRIPQQYVECTSRLLDLVPNHRGASLALRLLVGRAAREHERFARHEVRLLHELHLRAERDSAEAAAAVAGRLTHEHHARAAASRLDIGLQVLETPARRRLARSAIALVPVTPGIEYARGFRRAFLDEIEEARELSHLREILA